MKPTRTPPGWFLRKLKAIDGRYTARWSDAKNRWIIQERVPWATYVGISEGRPIYRTFHKHLRIIYAAELGSHVLEWVKRACIRRFETVDQMVKELNIDGGTTGSRGPASILAGSSG